MTDWSLWFGQLIRTVRNLASEPDAQKAYLASLGTEGSADELALEFDDMYRPLVHQLDQLNVPHSAVEKLARLDELVRRLAADVVDDLDGVMNV